MAEIYQFKGRENNMALIHANPSTVTDVKHVAEAFLSIESMTHKKLQKLSYYAYSWYRVLYGEMLFTNNFQAWVHGPVSPTLYQEYKVYGWKEIDKINDFEVKNERDYHVLDFVRQVYESYGHLTGDELEYITHKETPWIEARGNLEDLEPSTNPILDENILKYFNMVRENGQQE